METRKSKKPSREVEQEQRARGRFTLERVRVPDPTAPGSGPLAGSVFIPLFTSPYVV